MDSENSEREKPEKEGRFNREIRIKGVSDKTNQELTNICNKIGIGRSSFLKTHLTEIIRSFPPDYRNYTPPED